MIDKDDNKQQQCKCSQKKKTQKKTSTKFESCIIMYLTLSFEMI
jgi:hypothetical protein